MRNRNLGNTLKFQRTYIFLVFNLSNVDFNMFKGLNISTKTFMNVECSNMLKLYCRYEYTRPYIINRIWSLKQLTTGEWSCLISFIWAPLTCSERGGSEKFKMKIYVSSGTRTNTTPVHNRKVSAIYRSVALIRYQVEHFSLTVF